MEIIEIKVMRGPNYWSVYRKKLIVIKLDLEALEKKPTNKIPGFGHRLKELIPSLQAHRCSEDYEGGFFRRVEEGTWMGHIIEHIALEIQCLAGMECGFGRTRSTIKEGIYQVVFSYEIEEAGRYAAHASLKIAEALVDDVPYNIEEDITELKRIFAKNKLGPSTGSIVKEALKRKIPFKRLNSSSLITFGYGSKQKKIRATIADSTSGMGIEIACDKEETKKMLSNANIPVPKGVLVYDEEDIKRQLHNVEFPIVIKPIDGNHGRGVSINIQNVENAIAAFHIAKLESNEVIMEEFISGLDYRFLVINYKLVAVAKRTPSLVIGDGNSTVTELIEQTNQDPARGEGHEKFLSSIKVDEMTENILTKKNLEVGSVLPMGEVLFLKDTANISTGGTSTDVTDIVHPFNVFLAERIARILNLDICGIDIVTSDIKAPLTRSLGGVVEVNACPGLRMHLKPANGLARNVAEPIIEMMFPDRDNGRIPLVAVTGTNGKTTTTRLIAHLAKHAGGYKVGFTTTDGIYIQDHAVCYGDCTGSMSAEAVLLDPTIDFAVLECARGGIVRSGLGFDSCDISIVTNITEDHLGLKDIHTLEEMAKVKIIVPLTTKENGYAILNADDDLVYNMHKELDCKIALFSIDQENKRVKKHCEDGGLAAIVLNGYLTICKGKWKTPVNKITDIPLSLNGRSECMIKNLLPAVLAAVIQNFTINDIRMALQSFIPSPSHTPGRMNIFNFKEFDFMIDYAHNIDGFKELKKFLAKTPASVKVGIISVAGDRREEDIRIIGSLSAEMFDEIIIRHDEDMRGMLEEEMTRLLKEGIYRVNPDLPVKIISNEIQAIQYAIDNATKGYFITLCSEKVTESIEYLKRAKVKEVNLEQVLVNA
ncbi:MAG: cyanophycin synthetase [Bacteroidetes bacterium]|nr:cyanophycin synthetase [Bacteroidota bacterium]